MTSSKKILSLLTMAVTVIAIHPSLTFAEDHSPTPPSSQGPSDHSSPPPSSHPAPPAPAPHPDPAPVPPPHGGDGGWHPAPGPDPAAVGILAGLEAALLTTMTSNDQQYDAQTLQVQAAEYEDTRVEGAVFQSFADQVAQQMGDQANQVDQATFDDMVAQQFLSMDLSPDGAN